MTNMIAYYSNDFIKNMFRQEREVDNILLLLIGVLSLRFLWFYPNYYCPHTYSYKQNILLASDWIRYGNTSSTLSSLKEGVKLFDYVVFLK